MGGAGALRTPHQSYCVIDLVLYNKQVTQPARITKNEITSQAICILEFAS